MDTVEMVMVMVVVTTTTTTATIQTPVIKEDNLRLLLVRLRLPLRSQLPTKITDDSLNS